MELSKKTTILLSPELHGRLAALAATRRTSMGELIRQACERVYGDEAVSRRLAAVERLAALNAPAGTVEEMKRESVPAPKEICPDPV